MSTSLSKRLFILLVILHIILLTVFTPRSESAQEAGSAEKGESLFRGLGCLACHKIKGEGSNLGPDLNGVFGKLEELTTGEKITVTEDYLMESIVNPIAKVVKGFPPGLMPPVYSGLPKENLNHLVAFIKSLPAAETSPLVAGRVQQGPPTVWVWLVMGFVSGTLACMGLFLMSRSLPLKWIGVIVLVVLASTSGGVLWAQYPLNSSEKEFHLEARQFAYDPPIIRVNKGDRVTIKAQSRDVIHGLYLDGYDIDRMLRPGEPVQFTFIANKEGKFGFRCSLTCGVLHPFMIGKLIVEPNYLFPGSVGLAIGLAVSSIIFVAKKKEEE